MFSKISRRLGLLLAVPTLFLVAVAAAGLVGTRMGEAGLQATYENETIGLMRLSTVADRLLRARADTANGLLDHQLGGPAKHAEQLQQQVREMDAAWREYYGQIQDAQ